MAVCFLHSYANPVHERAVRHVARRLQLSCSVTLSSEIAPVLGEWERVTTTVANAYVASAIDGYLRDLRSALVSLGHAGSMFLMWSDGGFASVEMTLQAPIRLLDSGPAAGSPASSRLAVELAHRRVVAFDMGGTTAKICLVRDGEAERVSTFEVARVHRHRPGSGLTVRVPSVHMLEIGAGGGSIAQEDDLGLLTVGPESAGADAGPACYGRGGARPTVTDANLVLGYLSAATTLAGDLRLDVTLAERALASLASDGSTTAAEIALRVRHVVTENMAQAVKVHVTEQGEDPANFTLLAFGGAAPLHAYDIARSLDAAALHGCLEGLRSRALCMLRSAGVAGPLIVEAPHTTFVIGPRGSVRLSAHGQLVLEIADRPRDDARGGATSQPPDLEVLVARLRGIADPRGHCLALPTEWMPLFVSSMPRTIRLLSERIPVEALRPGDVVLTNDPWLAAGHKSDLVLVAPVFHRDRLVAFVGTILHVADIGGTLGDFRAWDVFEEGLALPPVKLCEGASTTPP